MSFATTRRARALKDQTNFPSLPSMTRHIEVRTANQQTNGGVT
jgi:hypothetical protein